MLLQRETHSNLVNIHIPGFSKGLFSGGVQISPLGKKWIQSFQACQSGTIKSPSNFRSLKEDSVNTLGFRWWSSKISSSASTDPSQLQWTNVVLAFPNSRNCSETERKVVSVIVFCQATAPRWGSPRNRSMVWRSPLFHLSTLKS